MKEDVSFTAYTADNKDACMTLFDENCPQYFAPNERGDYQNFLEQLPSGYEVCLTSDEVIAVFGLINNSLNWILISPRATGQGLGSSIMNRVIQLARSNHLTTIEIAASHMSKGFFAKHGAKAIAEELNGWGPGMHRVDMRLDLA